MTAAEKLAENLLCERKRAGISQEKLGLIAEVHRTEIGMLERGFRLPRIDTLIKLGSALEIRPERLLEGMEWRPGSARQGRFKEI